MLSDASTAHPGAVLAIKDWVCFPAASSDTYTLLLQAHPGTTDLRCAEIEKIGSVFWFQEREQEEALHWGSGEWNSHFVLYCPSWRSPWAGVLLSVGLPLSPLKGEDREMSLLQFYGRGVICGIWRWNCAMKIISVWTTRCLFSTTTSLTEGMYWECYRVFPGVTHETLFPVRWTHWKADIIPWIYL